MSGKGKGKPKKGAQSSRAQQQQQAAAKRNIPGTGSGGPADMRAGRPGTAVTAATIPPAPVPAPADETAAPVRHYLDVAAVRIQDWLGRTPDLKFRRGASVLLSEATAPDAWKGRLPAGAAWNDEAGNVDGVVSLVVDDNADSTDVAYASSRPSARRWRIARSRP